MHQEVAALCGLDQAMNGRLPFRPVLLALWQLRNVVGRVLQREQRPAVGQND